MFEVFMKELRELLRDKKTLLFVVAMPILVFPIIFGLIGFLMSQATLEAEQKVHTYAIANEAFAPSFAKEMFYHKSFKQTEAVYTTVEEMKQAVRDGKIDVGIIIQQRDSTDKLIHHG